MCLLAITSVSSITKTPLFIFNDGFISDLDKIDLENNEDRLTQINKLVNWMPKSEN